MDSLKTVYNEKPLIFSIKNFLTPEECNDFLNNKNLEFEPSSSFDYETNSSQYSSHRTSSTCFDQYEIAIILRQKAIEIVKDYFKGSDLTLEHAENTQFLKYQVGQQFKAHYDFFNHIDVTASENERWSTVIFYLNDDFESGETYFPKLNLKIKPEKGMILFFEYQHDYKTNTLTLHEGLPVTKGQKDIATVFLRSKPFHGERLSVVRNSHSPEAVEFSAKQKSMKELLKRLSK